MCPRKACSLAVSRVRVCIVLAARETMGVMRRARAIGLRRIDPAPGRLGHVNYVNDEPVVADARLTPPTFWKKGGSQRANVSSLPHEKSKIMTRYRVDDARSQDGRRVTLFWADA